MPNRMTLAQTILALKGLPDKFYDVSTQYHGRIVCAALGDFAPALRAAGIDATSSDDDGMEELWIWFKPEGV